jgi:hypothetical protein
MDLARIVPILLALMAIGLPPMVAWAAGLFVSFRLFERHPLSAVLAGTGYAITVLVFVGGFALTTAQYTVWRNDDLPVALLLAWGLQALGTPLGALLILVGGAIDRREPPP